jgi:hypothetical protein
VSREQHRTVLKVRLSDYPLSESGDLLGEYPLLKSPPVMRPARRHRPFGMSAYRRSRHRPAIWHRRRVVCATLLAAAAIVAISLWAVIADPFGVVIARLWQAWRPAPAFRVESNAAVLAAMNQFARKPFFAEALARGAPHLPYIRAIFADEQLPEELAYIVTVRRKPSHRGDRSGIDFDQEERLDFIGRRESSGDRPESTHRRAGAVRVRGDQRVR